jgi:hypothetical protein
MGHPGSLMVTASTAVCSSTGAVCRLRLEEDHGVGGGAPRHRIAGSDEGADEAQVEPGLQVVAEVVSRHQRLERGQHLGAWPLRVVDRSSPKARRVDRPVPASCHALAISSIRRWRGSPVTDAREYDARPPPLLSRRLGLSPAGR